MAKSRYRLVSLFAWRPDAAKDHAICEFYNVEAGTYEVWVMTGNTTASVPKFVLLVDHDDDAEYWYPDQEYGIDNVGWSKYDKGTFLLPQGSRKFVKAEIEGWKGEGGLGTSLYSGPLHVDYVSDKGVGDTKVTKDPANQELKTRNLSSRDRFSQDNTSFARRRKLKREEAQDEAFHDYEKKVEPKNPFKATVEEMAVSEEYTTPTLYAPGAAAGTKKFWFGYVQACAPAGVGFDVLVTFGPEGAPGQTREVGHTETFREAKTILNQRMQRKIKRGYEAAYI